MIKTKETTLKVLLLSASLLLAPNLTADTIQVTANLTGTTTWYNTNEYVLNGFIYVLAGGVLNIQPGTVVRGRSGVGLNSAALFITQGAKIFANGTRAKPIIFTSESDDLTDPTDISLYTRNLWGGIVIYGRSVLNTSSDATGNTVSPKYDVFEGLPDSQVGGQFINRYGGTDDDDNSGVMRYCSIRYSSTVILPNKEINALSLCAVGRGTTIENIECFAAGDDSVEFFDGTVNTKYMASIFSDDDNFDIDQGYRGKNQFWFALQAPDRKDNGGEWNGEPNGIAVSNAPIGNFEIYNATYIGAGTNTTGARAFISREYAAPRVFNTIFTEFNIGGNIDARSGVHFTNGLATFQNNIFWNFASNGGRVEYGNEFDIMGSGPGHLNANFKLIAGWLSEANVLTISNNGTYRVHAMDTGAELEPAYFYALRIPAGPPLHGLASDYWLDFRQQFTNNPLAMNGVLVHWATNTAGPDHNQLLDMNPGGVFDFRDAPLAVGRTFGDTARAIFITPTTRGTNTSPPGSAAPSTCRTPPR